MKIDLFNKDWETKMKVIDKSLKEYFDIHEIYSYYEYIERADWHKETHQHLYDYKLLEDSERYSVSGGKTVDWFGSESLTEALDFARFGWKTGLEKIEKKLDYDRNKIEKKFICEPINNVYGSYVNIGRYLSGMPDCMIKNEINTKPSRVKIIVACGFNALADKSDFITYGKNVIKIIDEMESRNIRTKIEVRHIVVSDDFRRVAERIILKDYSDFLDVNAIIFALCNPAFLRRISFSNRELMKNSKKLGFFFNGGYGEAKNLIVTEEEKQRCLCIDKDTSNFDYERFIIN